MTNGEDALRVDTARGRWTIAATVLGSGMAFLDGTVVGVATPWIGRDFHTGVAALQWVVSGYLLTLSGLLLLGGALGDRFGRRRVFELGVAGFAAASLLCGVAPNAATLIGARCLQGVAGALLTPGSLAILQASFAHDQRGRAIGAWSGLGGVTTAIGPVIGGWLVSAVSWRLVFLINLPIAVAVVLISRRHVPETRDASASGSLDVAGALLAAAGLAGVTYGLIEGPGKGWTSPAVVGALVVGVVALAGFVVRERTAAQPMLPLSIFSSRQFTATNVVTFIVYGALGGVLFLLPIQLQQVSGYSPIAAGVALLPVTVLMLLLSARSGALAQRIGPRLQMSGGPLLAGLGILMLARIDANGSYLGEVLPAAIVFGLGLSATVAPLTSTVLAAAPDEHMGVASAVNNDVARTAGLIAVAVLPVVSGLTGASYLHPAAFAHGYRIAIVICAIACMAGGLLALATIRNPRRLPEPQPQQA